MSGDPGATEMSNRGGGASRRRRVAILLFDDVEVLDFAGPFEVFGVARSSAGEPAFDVVTVALGSGEVSARNGLLVVPSLIASDLDRADILVVPGGLGTRREMTRSAMLEFLQTAAGAAELTLSVCTGALLLGAAGLLRGRAATTHWAAMAELQALDSGAEILPGARIVDNGSLVVCAGVSAGIDGALHVVECLLGRTQAEWTARAMEYDWTGFDRDGRPLVTRAP
ncbi:MAG TPA: DJ-1/PfpI family protein [Allosphingosinicella sp.]|jgi:transcriptional regulator GlxA family with amidase domain